MNLASALHAKLAADATLSSLLASYPSGSPATPAIFTSYPIPPDATRPFIVTTGDVSAINWDEYGSGSLGTDAQRDVACYADNTGSTADIDTIAARIVAVLHRQSLTIPGHNHVMTLRVNGPITAPTDETLVGRVVTFRIVAQET